MTNLCVTLWNSEDNFENCGEIGCTAVVPFETYSESRSLKLWAEKNIKAPQDSMHVETEVEQGGVVLRIHIVPHEEDIESLEEPEDWGRDETYLPMLRQQLNDWGRTQGYSVTFEKAF